MLKYGLFNEGSSAFPWVGLLLHGLTMLLEKPRHAPPPFPGSRFRLGIPRLAYRGKRGSEENVSKILQL